MATESSTAISTTGDMAAKSPLKQNNPGTQMPDLGITAAAAAAKYLRKRTDTESCTKASRRLLSLWSSPQKATMKEYRCGQA